MNYYKKANRKYFLDKWITYIILVLSYVLVYFHRMAPASISNELMAAFHTSGAALGSLAAVYYYIYTAMQIPSGVLSDTIGPKTTATIGNSVAGVGTLIFAFSNNIYSAGFGRFLVGLGVSVIFVSLMKSNVKWFSSGKYSFISGLTMFIGNMGSVVAAGPLAVALSLYSWRDIFSFLGFLSIILAILSFFFVKSRTEDDDKINLSSNIQDFDSAHWSLELRNIFTNRKMWPGFILNFGLTGSFFAFIGLWCVPYIVDVYSVSKEIASLYATLSLLSFAFGSLLIGWLSDKMKKRKILLIVGTFVYMLTWILIRFSNHLSELEIYLMFFLLGISASSFILTYSISKEQVNHNASGMAISFVNTGLFLGAALIQPLFGIILDLNWDGAMFDESRIYSLHSYLEAINLILIFSIASFLSSIFLPKTYYEKTV